MSDGDQNPAVRYVSMHQEIHLSAAMGLALFEAISSVVIVVDEKDSFGGAFA